MSVKNFFNKIHVTKALIAISLIFTVLMAAVPVVAVSKAALLTPLTSYVVRLDVEGKTLGYFSEVRFAGTENEVIESRILDSKGQATVMKVPGKLKISDVELKRALSNDMALSEWRQQVVNGDVSNARKDVSIYILDAKENIITQWDMKHTWPSALISGIDDKSSGKLNETVTLTCEQIDRVK